MSGADMTFLRHVEELRGRIIVSILAVLAVGCACFAFADPLLGILLQPSGGLQLRAFSIMDGLFIKVRLALAAGIALSFPVWAFEGIAFVLPALTRGERRSLAGMLVSAVVLFAAGTVFGYYILGMMIKVLLGLFPAHVEYLPSASDYISFVLFFLLACGIAFELPVLMVMLVRTRVLSAGTLRRHRRTAWFVLFALAELITPVTDPIVAPAVVFVPLLLLYEAGLLAAGRMEARIEHAARASVASQGGEDI
jgi:sec-independent protein translocase protein TatC